MSVFAPWHLTFRPPTRASSFTSRQDFQSLSTRIFFNLPLRPEVESGRLTLPDVLPARARNRLRGIFLCHRLPADGTILAPHVPLALRHFHRLHPPFLLSSFCLLVSSPAPSELYPFVFFSLQNLSNKCVTSLNTSTIISFDK